MGKSKYYEKCLITPEISGNFNTLHCDPTKKKTKEKLNEFYRKSKIDYRNKNAYVYTQVDLC